MFLQCNHINASFLAGKIVELCPELSDPENGKVFVFDKSAVYTCNTGYTLVGSPLLQCVSEQWIGQPPTCVLP